MKKKPAHEYGKLTGRHPITGQTTEESRLREQQWLKNGCNGFNMKSPISNPMSFWTEQDVLRYIKENNVALSSIYGEIRERERERERELYTSGVHRSGCIFCLFGAHCKDDDRFIKLKHTHPKQYAYCMGGGEHNENNVWQPNKNGLGMQHVINELHNIYGNDFIKLEEDTNE